jgi:hypothetical protein
MNKILTYFRKHPEQFKSPVKKFHITRISYKVLKNEKKDFGIVTA